MSTGCALPEELSGKRVTVVGLGRFDGGVGGTRWLCKQGARVTVSDRAPASELEDSIRQLDGLNATFHLGGHLEDDFLGADLLVVNPAIPREMPLLKKAREAHVPLTTEINLFLSRCRGIVVGITGSVGKSTTTAMVGEIFSRRYTTHVGGNIGRSLLEQVETIRPEHVVVLELSSFQLEDLPQIGISPHVAMVTNLMPNHLDRHGTMDAYGAAKKNIFRFQKADDVLILNAGCAVSSAWAKEARGKVAFFNTGKGEELFELAIPGSHNQVNAQGAWAVVREMGIDSKMAHEALSGFAGLPHRLQFVSEVEGVRYYNDSKCTTPEGAIVALNAFDAGKVIIIVGGYDKHVSFDELGEVIAKRAKGAVAIGATKDQISEAVSKCTAEGTWVVKADDLAGAVREARRMSVRGDVVLLSPACASYDMFRNYEQRGDLFAGLVGEK